MTVNGVVQFADWMQIFGRGIILLRMWVTKCKDNVNKSNNKILNSKGNVPKPKVDRTDKIEKCTERLAECFHTPDLVQEFSEENGGLNQVLRPAKPPTYMTTFIVLYQV